jgi:hypothetical protein
MRRNERNETTRSVRASWVSCLANPRVISCRLVDP